LTHARIPFIATLLIDVAIFNRTHTLKISEQQVGAPSALASSEDATE
jgi:hypothetical protein